MDHEVVVVGGGIGGLTVAALLAARGMDVCLFERQPEVGGCAANFTKFGFEFEPAYGLYSSWEPGAIHERIFSELPVTAPEVIPLDPAYAVRLPDQSQIVVGKDIANFEEQLCRVFPECATQAVDLYREMNAAGAHLRRTLQSRPELFWTQSGLKEAVPAGLTVEAMCEPVGARLNNDFVRFRRFIDAQLQILTGAGSNDVSSLQAALVLSQAQDGMFGIRGGGASLAARLAESIKTSGGRIRVDAPVLRISYDSAGAATGIDLLSGERVNASKAIVSNLTLWDTYGKLVGLANTPADVRARLKRLHAWGAYLMFLAIDNAALETLAADRLLCLTDWNSASAFDPIDTQLFFNAGSDSNVPGGKRAVTVHAFSEADDWFSFHTDPDETEGKDQLMLEECWTRLHSAMPELGANAEVIETMTPRDYYENTRRKLGMVGSVVPNSLGPNMAHPPYETFLPNLFVVSDTAHFGGLDGVSLLARALANRLSPK